MKLLRLLRLIFSPMKDIARELSVLRELYELDLSSRNPPVIRATEAPNPKIDTEVSYMDVEEKVPLFKRWYQAGDDDDDA